MALAVRMSGISKRYGAVQALDGVDLEVEAGALHAVIGENGAGKTTLMRILYGAEQADIGEIALDKPVAFRRPSDAIAAGVGMVSQHYGIIPGLSCLENLMLGAEPSRWLDLSGLWQRAQDLAQRLAFSFDWDADATNLSPAACQKLELLKLLWKDARIMILDEPTAMLSPLDAEALFENLKRLGAEGVTVILVTHRLPDVLEHCQTATVLRGGRVVAVRPVAETNAEELSRLIVGAGLESISKSRGTIGEPILELSGVSVFDAQHRRALNDVSLTVRAGEMAGVAGVDGNGQRELLRAVLGLAHLANGSIRYLNQRLDGVPTSERLARGMRAIPEDRHDEGVIEGWSLETNAALGLQRQKALRNGALINRPMRAKLAQEVADRFATRYGDLNDPISSLSGGNQQRFVAGRALALDPKLVVAFQPARGLDVLGTQAVYQGLRDACEAGAAALVISFELDELIDHCDRIVTLFGGKLATPSQGHELDRDVIGRQMVGLS